MSSLCCINAPATSTIRNSSYKSIVGVVFIGIIVVAIAEESMYVGHGFCYSMGRFLGWTQVVTVMTVVLVGETSFVAPLFPRGWSGFFDFQL